MERLQATFDKLLRETTSTFHRYMYYHIDWEARIVGLLGPRGVGKTTMVLQYIKENLPREQTLYVVAEDLYFSQHTLVDMADAFARTGGKHLFIDEIHKYKGWSRELKLIYDYHSELHIFFTGSSVLDISKGVADLSRRVLTFEMQGLSYREYLQLFHEIELPTYNLQQILSQQVVLPQGFLPLQHFADYLKQGYYPFRDNNFNRYIMQMVNATLDVDIAQYADLTPPTIRKLKRLLAIIAQAAPFKPNFTQIGGQLEVSRNNIADLCAWLEKAGLIGQLRESTGGIQGLGKVDKVYLDNTALIYALGNENTDIGTIRETFFFNQMRVNQDITSSPVSDFLIDREYTIEVGGKKKKQKQIRSVEQGYVVKDDIETGYGNIIPLWQFGLTY
ncbi:MAG: AAA family ATPase [Bacteroidales bacterium]|nr:AAA family ATPase [Bacteroidales bacterium]